MPARKSTKAATGPKMVKPRSVIEEPALTRLEAQLRESAESAFAAEERLVKILKREGLLDS